MHIADVHLGVRPEAGKAYSEKRDTEIWETFRKIIMICEEEKTDLLLIAGDLFHRQPLLRELKEVNDMFGSLSYTEVVMIAGNHDYIKPGAYYGRFDWEPNVHMLAGKEPSEVQIPKLKTSVCGCSYHERKITETLYDKALPSGEMDYEILLLHGGDKEHLPIDKAKIEKLGYDYTALGHIHKPTCLIPGKAAYAGALEPTDINDTGKHGYIRGEITKEGCRFTFVPFATREYVHLALNVKVEMSGFSLRNVIQKTIEENGKENIYKFLLKGYRDPEIRFDLTQMDVYGNIAEITDETKPAYDFEKLYEKNKDNLLGSYIASFANAEKDSMEYEALCAGVLALMETKGESYEDS
ncbi:DNA repair exonuclease [Claveliimonas bilis]|nr:DNA repair exonuclease [Claveliimonas bilis]